MSFLKKINYFYFYFYLIFKKKTRMPFVNKD